MRPDHGSTVTQQATIRSLTISLLVFGAAFTVYLVTLEPDLSWAFSAYDGGELITASYRMGVAHPPGYATYILLGKFFSSLPLGTVAFRYNLFSAVCIATAAGVLSATIDATTHRRGRIITIVGLALAFAFVPIVWGQAIVAEVYGLNLAVLSFFLYFLLAKRNPFVSGLFLGLAMTTHLTSLLMLPLALLVLGPRSWARLGAGIALGLIPLLAIPLLGRSGSPVIWGDPTTFRSWWEMVSGRLYQDNISILSISGILNRGNLWNLAVAVAAGIGLIATVVISRRRPPVDSSLPVLIGLWLTALIYGCFALVYATADSFVLVLPAFLLIAIAPAATVIRYSPAIWFAIAVFLIAGVFQIMSNDEPEVRLLAEPILQRAPNDTLILTPGDRTIFALWYFHHVEEQRPDVVLADYNLLAFDWYREQLQKQYPHLNGLGVDDVEGFLTLNQASRPVCLASLHVPVADAFANDLLRLPVTPVTGDFACLPETP